MLKTLLKNPIVRITIVLYIALLVFWAWINFQGLRQGQINNLYGALYPIISLIGALYGLFFVSKKWGGWKSVMGRGIIFLSLGLLGGVFGQWTWSYYVILKQIEIPYPSIADIGYFSIIPFYGYAMYNFAKVSGVKVNLRTYFGKLQAIVIPLIMIGIAYWLFLRNIEIDTTNWLKTFLDFGYPGFEAVAVSIGILTFSLSYGILGGVMRSQILYLIFALVVQYITDYTFLYRASSETYYNAGPVDLMYATSFAIMVIGITLFATIEEKK